MKVENALGRSISTFRISDAHTTKAKDRLSKTPMVTKHIMVDLVYIGGFPAILTNPNAAPCVDPVHH